MSELAQAGTKDPAAEALVGVRIWLPPVMPGLGASPGPFVQCLRVPAAAGDTRA